MTGLPAPHTPEPIGEERRQHERAPRALTLLITARLVVADRENLCRIRNVSETGLMIETMDRLAPGQRICVELRTGRQLTGDVAWAQSGKAGVKLLEPVAVQEIVALQAAPQSRLRRMQQPRSPRIAAETPIEVQYEGRTFGATLLDISQGGVRVRLPFKASIGERIPLMIPDMPLKLGLVRWVGAETGLVFAEPLPFTTLSAWLAARSA